MAKGNKKSGIKPGTNVSFTGMRISVGNPVKGKLISEDDEWIEVKLSHTIEWLVNVWFAGETKNFRKCLITGLKSIK